MASLRQRTISGLVLKFSGSDTRHRIQTMYFPTEPSLRTLAEGVWLCSQPIAEIANLSINDYFWANLTLSPGNNPLSGIRGTLFHLRTTFAAVAAEQMPVFAGDTAARPIRIPDLRMRKSSAARL